MEEHPIRSFLAIEVPPEILAEVERVQVRLKKTIQGVLRWVRPQAMHLTLKFLGDIRPSVVPALGEGIRATLRAARPPALEIRGLGVFPDLNRPRVIWVGAAGDGEALRVLQRSLEESLEAMGYPRENRPFQPHLTLARIKTPRGLVGLARALEIEGGLCAGAFQADELHLFQSELKPQGAVYTKLASFPLGGGDVSRGAD